MTIGKSFPRRLAAALLASALLLLAPLTGCSKDKDKQGEEVTLEVFAAASLTKTYTEIAEKFEKENPGVKVNFNFQGSSTLVEQMINGAPVDVFASADEKNMQKALDAAIIDGDPIPFVANNLTIAVAPGNPHQIKGLADLTNPDLKVVICAEQVPCGNATKKVVSEAGITLNPVSEEEKVTNVLGKVTSGEADAGLVYRTDVQGSDGKAEAVDFPETEKATNIYPIAKVKNAPHPELAQKFIDYVLSAESQKIFADAGFASPNK